MMSQAAPAHIALATLNHGAQLDAALSGVLHAAGAEIVYEADLSALDFAALKASGARVVVVNLALDQTTEQESSEDAAVDVAIDQLHAGGFDVVFNEVQDTAGVSSEQRARWVRHLVAKILHRPDFILPPQPEGAPGISSAAPVAVVAAATVVAAAAPDVPAEPSMMISAPEPRTAEPERTSWLDAQSALDMGGEPEIPALPEVQDATPAAELSWLDAQAALNSSTAEDAIEPSADTHADAPALSWQDVQDALEMRTAEDDESPTVPAHDAAPALSWQEAQDALDFRLLDDDAGEFASGHADDSARAPALADASEESAHAPAPEAELIDWDHGFKLVDMDPSERPTLELPLPDDLLQAASESLPLKSEAAGASENNVSAPDWGLVPIVDEKPAVDVEKEFEAKAMYIPDAANKKRHDFDLNDTDGRSSAESNKDKSS